MKKTYKFEEPSPNTTTYSHVLMVNWNVFVNKRIHCINNNNTSISKTVLLWCVLAVEKITLSLNIMYPTRINTSINVTDMNAENCNRLDGLIFNVFTIET